MAVRYILLLMTFFITWKMVAQPVTISTTPTKQAEGIGYTAYTVTPTVTGDFQATVFFRASSPTLAGATFTFTPPWISYPYDTATQMKVVALGSTPPGDHLIIVEAYNGPMLVRNTCTLTVAYRPGWKVFTTDNSPLPMNKIQCIAIANNGIAWIGTSGGLTSYDGNKWTTYTKQNSDLPYNNVKSVAIDSTGGVWAGMLDGLVEFRDGVMTTHEPRDVETIAVDREGTVWCAGRGSLVKFGRPTSTFFTKDNSQLIGQTSSIVFDRNNKLWTDGSEHTFIIGFDGSYWTYVDTARFGFESTPYAMHLATDHRGDVWVTSSLGLLKFEGLTHTAYKKSTSNRVFPGAAKRVCFDYRGTSWIATHNDFEGSDGGFGRFESGKWWFYDMSNSALPSNYITEMVVDNKRTVWIGTDKGLALFDGNIPPAGIPTSVAQDTLVPLVPLITSVAPHPVSGVSSITLTLVANMHVRLALHNSRGQEVVVLCDKMLDKGERVIQVDGTALPAGAYVVRLVAGDVVESKAVIVNR